MIGRDRSKLNELMLRLKEGDRQAFGPAYAMLWPPLLAFAQTILSRTEDAEDAAQEALVKVFARAYQYQAGRDALAWTFTFVAYECRTISKRKQRKKESSTAVMDEWAFSQGSEDELISKRMRDLAFSLIKDLKPLDQEVILRTLAEDEKVKESRYRKRLERALKRLKLMWDKRYAEQESTTPSL